MQRGFTVTLSKPGNDNLKVESINIDTRAAQKGAKETERFVCGGFEIGAASATKKDTKFCKAGPFDLARVEQAKFTMGNKAGDGTNDDVVIRIKSDVDETNVCQVKLSG